LQVIALLKYIEARHNAHSVSRVKSNKAVLSVEPGETVFENDAIGW